MAFYKKFAPEKGKGFGGASQGKGARYRQEEDGRNGRNIPPSRENGYSQGGRPSSGERGYGQGGRPSSNSSGRRSYDTYPGQREGAGRSGQGAYSGNARFDRTRSQPARKGNFSGYRPSEEGQYRRGPAGVRPAAPRRFVPKAEQVDPPAPAAEAPQARFEPELPENLLSGRNPIREAIKTGRDIEKLLVAEGDLSGSAREIVSLARNAGIMVQTVERSRLDQITRNHQGMIAFASAFAYSTLDEILDTARERGEQPFIVILDKITDPMNLGAIIRSAACVGAHGVIVQQHRAVGLTPSAVRASAGAVEHVKVARVTNINQTIRQLKDLGIWVYAADAEGTDYRKVDFRGGCALVIGSEGEGISKLTLDLCDTVVSIPMSGVIDSLNASVAAGILMYGVYTGREAR